ncbi:MAG: hypothetical protein DRP80_04555 [Candidatus Omnitrophota bacterium]|nr:MAG: hypothetical protein DRP69_04280 [Candidatus Omnitrophota bacterium]RKY43683.1 MAG: hypothetical protein DRP80_04555 [Candidatus Omnitrophota bacterium]
MDRESLVIIPLYNEEKNLIKLYSLLRSFYSGDVLFVDDGSVDKSRLILSEFKSSNTFIISHRERKGLCNILFETEMLQKIKNFGRKEE